MTNFEVRLMSIGVLMATFIAGCSAMEEPRTAGGETGREGARVGDSEAAPALSNALNPLTAKEIQDAMAIAAEDRQVRSLSQPSVRSELLFVQRFDMVSEEDKTSVERMAGRRQAEVLYYVYSQVGEPVDATINVLIDLSERKIVNVNKRTGVQPPITRREIEAALQLALNDEQVLKEIARLGVSKGEIEANALLYRPDNESEHCAQNRCLELSLNTAKQALPFTPIVNLSRQIIETVRTASH